MSANIYLKNFPKIFGFDKNFLAITLFPFGIYFNKRIYGNILNDKDIKHELVHWLQSIELLGIFFYILYGLEFILKLPFYGRYAYWNLSFEREANFTSENRKCFGWIKYIFK